MHNRVPTGERLRAARRAAGFKTALTFCDKFDIPRSTYSQHESGSRKVNDHWVQTYARHLGVNAGWLKTGEGEPFATLNQETRQDMMAEINNASMVDDIIQNRYTLSPIDEELLAGLLQELMKSSHNSDKLDYLQLAKAVAGLYQTLRHSNNDPEIRREMIKVAVDAYQRFYKPQG